MIIGITPTPAPMAKKFDWGFMAETLYGRQGNGGRMTGFDRDWSMNPSPVNDAANRYMYLDVPNVYLDLYVPILKGVAFRLGRQADQLMIDEAPPNFRAAPNMFYSHPYSFYRVSQVFGGRVDATILHSQQYGYLMGQFFVDNGLQTVYSMSGTRDYMYALNYRTPKMDTWIDYSGRYGAGNVKANAGCAITGCTTPIKPLWVSDNLAGYHVFSPHSQMMFENALIVQKEFRPHWKVVAQVQFGKQYGDGQSDTIATYSPAAFGTVPGLANGINPGICMHVSQHLMNGGSEPLCKAGFTGASYLSFEGLVTYNFNKKWNVSFRPEQFRNPNGYFLEPMAAAISNANGTFKGAPPDWGGIKGAFNDVTGGVNYKPTIYSLIRAEVRYDWQSGNYLANGFGQGNPNGVTSSSQFEAGIETVMYF